MFSSSQKKESVTNESNREKIIDPLTIWLIRIACFVIIVFISSVLIGIPVLITFGKSFFDNSLISLKEVLKILIEEI